MLFVPAAATPEDEAGWAAVLFFEVDAAAGAVDVEAAPILGELDDEVESETVKGRFSSDRGEVVVVVPTAAASLAAAASWWSLFSREFISFVVVAVKSVPPPVVPPTRVVPSLAGAAAAGVFVDSVPDALVRREAVEGL